MSPPEANIPGEAISPSGGADTQAEGEAEPWPLEDVLEEDKRRRKEQREARRYDPLLGIGSPIERTEVRYDEGRIVRLPNSMMQDSLTQELVAAGSVPALATRLSTSQEEIEHAIFELRLQHDFEFWAATCANIYNKAGDLVSFKLNRPQRKFLGILETQRQAGDPLRVILLKARQWGGSTMTQLYAAWIQNVLKKGWNLLIVAKNRKQARRIRAMYTTMAKHYPSYADPPVLAPYEGAQNTRWIKGREGILDVSSVATPDADRSFTLHMMHLSEVGLWRSSPRVNAEAIAQSLAGAIPDLPLTLRVLESTANGVGNYFHTEWGRASRGESNNEPLFVAWHELDSYERNVSAEERAGFVRSWSKYEWFLFEEGATIGQIKWYRHKLRDFSGDEWRMKTEFPTTPKEAFQTSGRRVFPPLLVRRARKNSREPLVQGNLHARASTGPKALEDIRFRASGRGGYLRVWARPGEVRWNGEEIHGIAKASKIYPGRYAAFADIGGTTRKADYSCVCVVDRIWQRLGGGVQVVAEWHGHLDQDLFAWRAARLAEWYETALLAIEINSLRVDSDAGGDLGYEPDHALTVLDKIKHHYDNLYYRHRPERIDDGMKSFSGLIGFHTNASTKPMIMDTLKAALRDGMLVEHASAACDELDYYEKRPDGQMAAMEGQKDDRVITRAGAAWLALEHMDPVAERERPSPKRTRQQRRARSEALSSPAVIR